MLGERVRGRRNLKRRREQSVSAFFCYVEVDSVSDVVNFSLEQVIIPSLFGFRSRSLPRVCDDYFHIALKAVSCVDVDAESLLVSATSIG